MATSYKYRVQCQPAKYKGVDRWITVFVGEPSKDELKSLRGAWAVVDSAKEADEFIEERLEWTQRKCLAGEAEDVLEWFNKLRGSGKQ